MKCPLRKNVNGKSETTFMQEESFPDCYEDDCMAFEPRIEMPGVAKNPARCKMIADDIISNYVVRS